MAKRIVIAFALAAAAGAGFAQTTIGGATLIDTAAAINGIRQSHHLPHLRQRRRRRDR